MELVEKGQKTLEAAREYRHKDDRDELKAARKCYKEAVKIFESIDIKHPVAELEQVKPLLAQTYFELGDVLYALSLDSRDPQAKKSESEENYRKAATLGHAEAEERLDAPLSSHGESTAQVFFTENPHVEKAIKEIPPDPKCPVKNTQNLALLLQQTNLSLKERKRFETFAEAIINEFADTQVKSQDVVREAIALAPVHNKEIFRELLKKSIDAISESTLEELHVLHGLAEVIRNAERSYLNKDDCVKILKVLHVRLNETHEQESTNLYNIIQAIGQLLDSMVDISIAGIKRAELHVPLSELLYVLSQSEDVRVSYQARYAYQALQHIPDDESPWEEFFRHTGNVLLAGAAVTSALTNLDATMIPEALKQLAKGFNIAEFIRTSVYALENIKTFADQVIDRKVQFQKGIEFVFKPQWYSALRYTDTLVRSQQLVELEQFIRELRCRANGNFLCGLCHQLEQLALMQQNKSTQESIIDFIGHLYKANAPTRVKATVLVTLVALAEQPCTTLQTLAQRKLKALEENASVVKKELYKMYVPAVFTPLPAESVDPEFPTTLLDAARKKPHVAIGENLAALKLKYLKEWEDSQHTYIKQQGKWNAHQSTTFDLEEEARKFLKSDKRVLLIHGDAGAGKSTFNLYLTQVILHDRDTEVDGDAPIPLLVRLPLMRDPSSELIPEYLKSYGFSEEAIQDLKEKYTFVFLLDGYDEISTEGNLYNTNQMHEWKTQMVITCRTDYLRDNYQTKFKPAIAPDAFQEIVVAPFSVQDIYDYVEQYVGSEEGRQRKVDYKVALDRIPSLKHLLSNPFILRIAMESLPNLMKRQSSMHITRLALYDTFVDKWFKYAKKRQEENLTGESSRYFLEECFRLSMQAAVKLYKTPAYKGVIDCSTQRSEDTWLTFFGTDKDNIRQVLFTCCPLMCRENRYSFLHKSLLEYFVARAIFKATMADDTIDENLKQDAMSLLTGTNLVSDPTTQFLVEYAREAKQASAFKIQLKIFIDRPKIEESRVPSTQEADEKFNWADLHRVRERFDVLSAEDNIDKNFKKMRELLVKNDVSNDLAASGLVVEYVRLAEASEFKRRLYMLIARSKTDDNSKIAAANAITVLVKAGEQFNKADLSGVRIPGADLSHGVFDHAQLQGADMTDVKFVGAWLRAADMTGAKLSNAYFGETPELEFNDVVRDCCYLNDSQLAVVEGSRIHLHNTETLEPIRTFTIHNGLITSLALSPNRKQLVSGSSDSIVRLWDTKGSSLEPTHTFSGHTSAVWHVAFSPDGKQLASGSDDETVRLWNTQGVCLKATHTFTGHTRPIKSIAFSPDGKLLASSSLDNNVYLWNTRGTGLEAIHTFTGHTDSVYCVAFSPNGIQLASGSQDSTVQLWDAQSTGLKATHTLTGHTNAVWHVAFSPDGKQLASGSSDKTVRLWSAQGASFEATHIFSGHTNFVLHVTFSPDGKQLASCGFDNTVRLWDTQGESLEAVYTFSGHTRKVACATYSPDGKQLASGSDDNTVRLWDTQGARLETTDAFAAHHHAITCVTFASNGKQLVSGSADAVQLWNIQGTSLDIIRTFTGCTSTVDCVAFSPDGKQLASSTDDNVVHLWDTQGTSLGATQTFTGHTSWITSVVFSPDGKKLVSGSEDNDVRLWNIDKTSMEASRRFTGHTSGVCCVAFSPDGKKLASGSSDSTVRVWNTQGTGSEATHTFTGHTNAVWHVAFSPDGKQLASGSNDETVRLWDTQGTSLDATHTLTGHTRLITSMAFSPDGKQLASGSLDSTVRVWCTLTGKCLTVIGGFIGNVKLAWCTTAHSTYLLTCSLTDFIVRKWRINVIDKRLYANLHTTTDQDSLMVMNTCIQDVKGLSVINKQLLKQRGAIEEPLLVCFKS